MFLRIVSFVFLIIPLLVHGQPVSENMTLLYNWDPDTLPTVAGVAYNDLWGYTDCHGREYAIIGSAAKIHFFDITETNAVKEIANFDGGGNTIWRDIKTYCDRAYGVADQGSEGLLVFDMSQAPSAIRQSNQIRQYFQRAHNIFIDEFNGRMYVAGSNTQRLGLIVLDLTKDPDQPALLSSVSLPGGGYVHDLYVRNNIAYCSHGYNGFYVWDFNDPAHPVLLASTPTSGYNHSSWVSDDGKYAIYAEEIPKGIPLGIIDLSNMYNNDIEVINTFKFPLLAPEHTDNTPHNPYIRGKYAIVSYYEDGVVIFDISDPMNPSRVAFFDTAPNNADYNGTTNNWGVYPFFPSGNIIASDTENGLFVFSANFNFAGVPDPYTTIQTDGRSTICEGESLILRVPNCKDYSYQWYRNNTPIEGATTSEWATTLEGEFMVEVAQKDCVNRSAAFRVVVAEPLQAVIEVENGSAASICDGNPITLFTTTGADHYQWQKDGQLFMDNSNFVEVTAPGVYSLKLEKSGCSATDSITVTTGIAPNFTIAATGETTVCPGQAVKLETGVQAEAYSWLLDNEPMQVFTKELEALESGVYQLQATNDGCTAISNPITITHLENPRAVIANQENLISATHAQGFQWYLNGAAIPGASNQTYRIQENGDYYVVVTYENGCTAQSNTLSLIYTSVQTPESLRDIQIFPNPVVDHIFINKDHFSESLDLQVFNINGQLMGQQIWQADSVVWDFSSYPSGIYLIKIANSEGFYVTKVLKR